LKLLVLLFSLGTPLVAQEITPADLDRLPAADVVILGETHDNPAHHANQARAVMAIQPTALVFEMLTPAQAARTPNDRGDADALARAYDWGATGWPDFAMYHPIFAAAPLARVFGADVARDDLARAMSDGAAAAFGMDAARFGLDAPLAAHDLTARLAEQATAHCDMLPADLLPGMVEAQRLRDAALARAALQAVVETGGPVAVITGSGHARNDTGVPALLRLAKPSLTVLSIGQIEGAPEGDVPFDLWIVTDGVAGRGDPCAAFGTN
jgi:uncharacterized iron-regulated protein